MEGAGFRGSGGHSSHHSGGSNWPRHNNHQHRHHGNGSGIIPGVIGGTVGGVLAGHLLGNRNQSYPQYGAIPQPIYQPVTPTQQRVVYTANPTSVQVVSESVRRRSHLLRKFSRFIFSVLFIVFVIFFILLATVPRSSSTEIELTGGDRKLMKPDSNWLKEIEIAGSSDMKAYLLNKKPTISEILRFPPVEVYPNLSGDSFHFMRFDLFSGSKVVTTWNFNKFNVPPSLIILRTTFAFDAWKSGGTAFGNIMHTQQGARGSYDFTVPNYNGGDPDSSVPYYFVFYTEARRQYASGIVSFDVTARTYAISGAVAACPATINEEQIPAFSPNTTSICSFSLTRGKQQYVLLVAPVGLGPYTVSYSTIGRESIFAWLFSLLPIALSILCLLSCLACCGCLNPCFDFYAARHYRETLPVSRNVYAPVPSADDSVPPPLPPDPPFNPQYDQVNPQPNHEQYNVNIPPPYSETDPILGSANK
ncbi:hypothetical protein HK098_002784 [Nowakowskiella sp. JEL0407]|nr:hypothetical protein HK098_002784 [Nowakowskiella sp. JEL0407]